MTYASVLFTELNDIRNLHGYRQIRSGSMYKDRAGAITDKNSQCSTGVETIDYKTKIHIYLYTDAVTCTDSIYKAYMRQRVIRVSARVMRLARCVERKRGARS